MQEKKILPRRKGVVLLSVLGCLFVFFAKTEKDLASAGNILWTAGYIGSTLLWTVVLGCLLGFLGTWVVHRLWNRAQTAEDTGKKQDRGLEALSNGKIFGVCPPFRLAAAPLRCADIFRKSVVSAVGLAAGISGILSRNLCL